MTQPLTESEIEHQLRSGFMPLRCGTEVSEIQGDIKFHVYDRNDVLVFESPRVPFSRFCDGNALSVLIVVARGAVEVKGHPLDPITRVAALPEQEQLDEMQRIFEALAPNQKERVWADMRAFNEKKRSESPDPIRSGHV